MIQEIINKPSVREFIDSLPAENRLIGALKLYAKALLFRKRIYRGTRVLWPGVEDTAVEKYALLGPGPSEVLVKTEFTAISPGTERQYYLNAPNFHIEYPHVPGYSGAGVVLAVGKGVGEFVPGDRVAGVMKHSSLNGVPADSLVRIPEGVESRPASLVTLGVIALTAIREAKIRPGQTAAVIGQGMIGQLILALARSSGAGKTIAVARTKSKRELSLQTGADEFLSTEEDADKISTMKADVVFEASGASPALHTAFTLCRPGGRIVLAGSSTEAYANSDLKKELISRNVTLVGAHVRNIPASPAVFGSYRRESEFFLSLLASGKLRVEHLIKESFLPSQAKELYGALAKGESFPGAILDWEPQVRVPLAAPATLTPAETLEIRPEHIERGTVRFALVGCGAIAGLNAAAIQAASGAELALVMDTSEDSARRLAGSRRIPYTTDYDAVLSDDSIDAVFISVPHHLHCELCLEAARAGKHVVVEKPIAMNTAEARRMIEECRRHEVALSVCFPMRYSPALRRARRFIEEGGLGELLGTRIVMYRDRSELFLKRNTWLEAHPDWRGDKKKSGGGILMDNVPHYLDYYRFLTGLEVVEVIGIEDTSLLPVDVEDTAQIICRYSNGATGNISVSSAVRGGGTEQDDSVHNTDQGLWGAEGQLILYPCFQAFSRRRVLGLAPNRWHRSRMKPAAGLNERKLFVEGFARAVLTGAEPEVTGEDGLRTLAVIEAAYRSAREKRWVGISEVLGEGDD